MMKTQWEMYFSILRNKTCKNKKDATKNVEQAQEIRTELKKR